MSGVVYTIPAIPTRRFKSQLELRWYGYLATIASYLSYELVKIRPTTPGWSWMASNDAKIWVSDFFLKLPFDPTYHVAEVKPVRTLDEFEDYLPKPERPTHRLYLLGAKSVGSYDEEPGPIWRWIEDAWVPWELQP